MTSKMASAYKLATSTIESWPDWKKDIYIRDYASKPSSQQKKEPLKETKDLKK
jgi:hypothetical protein